MKRMFTGWALILAGLCLTVLHLRAEGEKDSSLRASLVGTWRMVSSEINGKKDDFPEKFITYKHVTPVGFVWLTFDKETGKIFRSAGGVWAVHGDAYQEKIEYGFGDDFAVIKNTYPSFKFKLAGDKWSPVGNLANGTHLEETWERVKPAGQEKAKQRPLIRKTPLEKRQDAHETHCSLHPCVERLRAVLRQQNSSRANLLLS